MRKYYKLRAYIRGLDFPDAAATAGGNSRPTVHTPDLLEKRTAYIVCSIHVSDFFLFPSLVVIVVICCRTIIRKPRIIKALYKEHQPIEATVGERG